MSRANHASSTGPESERATEAEITSHGTEPEASPAWAPWAVGAAVAAAYLLLLVDPAGGRWLPKDVVDTDDVAFVGTVFEQAAAQWRSGRAPLWFPEFDGGTPLAAAWMYGLFYPGLALFLVLPLGVAWAWTAALHAGFGAAGMASFLRRRGCGTAALVAGAVLFAVSEHVAGRTTCGHLNLVLPVAWMPWVLRWADGCVQGERRAVPMLALCAAAGLLSGHVQAWFYLAPLAAAVALSEAWGRSDRAAVLGRLALGAGLGVGIAGVQAVLAAEFLSWAAPVAERPEIVRDVSVPPAVLASKLLAAFLGPAPATGDLDFRHEHRGIAGIWAWGLAAWGLARGRGRRGVWAAFAVLGAVAAMGTRTPMTAWIQDVPPFSLARSPGRFLMLPLVCVPVLAALGVDALPLRRTRRNAVVAAVCAAAVLFGIPKRGVFPVLPATPDDLWRQDLTPLLPPEVVTHRIHAPLLYQVTNLERTGLRTMRTPCYVRTRGWADLLERPSPAVAWWVDLAADVEPGKWIDDPSGLVGIATLRPTTLEAMGPARFFDRATFGVPRDEVIRRLRDGERTLFVEGPADPPPATRGRWVGSVAVEVPDPDTVVVRTDAPGPGWVVVSMRRFPGWTATVDGAPAEIRTASLALPAVRVEGGRREIVLSYAPWSFRAGAALSLLSLAATLVMLVRAGRPGRAVQDG